MLEDAMIRTQRSDFFAEFAEVDSNGYKTIFRLAPGELDAKEIKYYIGVVFALEWPSLKGRLLIFKDLEEDASVQAIVSNLFRTKNFFELNLRRPLFLYEVKVGCVKARYSYSSDVSRKLIQNALTRFQEVRHLYDASSVSAHYDGRLVKSGKNEELYNPDIDSLG